MIRKTTLTLTMLLVLVPSGFAAEMQHHQPKPAPSSPAFDRMKSLVGDWKATIPGMGEVTATYTMHSGGGALLEQLMMPAETSMITVYYPSGNDVSMTHFCSEHNQPQMIAKGSGGQNLDFSLVSVSNLAS